jgi:DNA anti-recombination protein RmuC
LRQLGWRDKEICNAKKRKEKAVQFVRKIKKKERKFSKVVKKLSKTLQKVVKKMTKLEIGCKMTKILKRIGGEGEGDL